MRPIVDHSAEHAATGSVVPAAEREDRQVRDDATPDRDGRPTEIGGREGPEPTRFGDWERNGRCIDF
jgi:hypothetical protein